MTDARSHRAPVAVERVVTDELTLRHVDGAALFTHALTRYGFSDGWRAVAGPDADRVLAI